MVNSDMKVVESVRARGSFLCPYERESVAYVFKRVIPSEGTPGEFVECRSCGTVFPPTVLGGDEATQQSSLQEAFTLLFSAMIVADAEVKPRELQSAKELAAHVGVRFDADALARGTERVRGDLSDVLRVASENLSIALRRELLVGSIVIAGADGEVSSEERRLIANAGRHMGFTRAAIDDFFESSLA